MTNFSVHNTHPYLFPVVSNKYFRESYLTYTIQHLTMFKVEILNCTLHGLSKHFRAYNQFCITSYLKNFITDLIMLQFLLVQLKLHEYFRCNTFMNEIIFLLYSMQHKPCKKTV